MPRKQPAAATQNDLENYLRETLADLRLSDEERQVLRTLGKNVDIERARFMRNKAFELVRKQLDSAPETLRPTLKWLEQVIKTLDVATTREEIHASACFSPGPACRNKVCGLLKSAAKSVDICVFTITDGIISKAIIDAHKRGVAVRVITDDEKSLDGGSDIDILRDHGVPLVMDMSENHMHHKFAIFDGECLLNGSFNWTRSATEFNQENIMVTTNPALVAPFRTEFEKLWRAFAKLRPKRPPRVLVKKTSEGGKL